MTVDVIALGLVQTGGFNGGGSTVMLDPDESNFDSENATFLDGLTFGSPGSPARDAVVTATFNDTNGNGGLEEDDAGPGATGGETFTIGGVTYALDSVSVHELTVTYMDGTTGTGFAQVLQATNGEAFLVPIYDDGSFSNEFLDKNGTQPLQSIHFDRTDGSNYYGADATPESSAFVVCFADGTMIQTLQGERKIESLTIGDMVETVEYGPMPIKWLAHSEVEPADLLAKPNLCPVRIKPGILGNHRALLVSKQHCMLIAATDDTSAYVRAGHLAEETTVASYARGRRHVTYYHILLKHHATIWANGLPSESFYPEAMALKALSESDRSALFKIVPALRIKTAAKAYGPRANKILYRKDVKRLSLVECMPSQVPQHRWPLTA